MPYDIWKQFNLHTIWDDSSFLLRGVEQSILQLMYFSQSTFCGASTKKELISIPPYTAQIIRKLRSNVLSVQLNHWHDECIPQDVHIPHFL